MYFSSAIHIFCLISPFHFDVSVLKLLQHLRVLWKSRTAVKVLTVVFEGSGPPHQQGSTEESVYTLVCVWEYCCWWRWPLLDRSVLWGEWDLYTAALAGICAWEVFNFLKSQLHSAGGGLLFCLQLRSWGCPCVWILNVCVGGLVHWRIDWIMALMSEGWKWARRRRETENTASYLMMRSTP